MGKPVSFFTCKVFTHFIHCLSLELPPTWNTGKKWQFPINATSSSSSVWTWETLEYNLFRSPLQLHHKPPLAKPWSYKRLVLFSTEQKIRFFFTAWHPAHATRAACRWGTGPTPEHGRSPGAAPRGGNGPPHAAASPAAAQPSPAAPLSAPRRRAERGAGGGPHPGPARGRALSGRGSPPTRPAPPQPGLGLPLPLPLLRASRRHTRLGQAAHSASAIFSPPSGGGAAQARWVQRGTWWPPPPSCRLVRQSAPCWGWGAAVVLRAVTVERRGPLQAKKVGKLKVIGCFEGAGGWLRCPLIVLFHWLWVSPCYGEDSFFLWTDRKWSVMSLIAVCRCWQLLCIVSTGEQSLASIRTSSPCATPG